MNIVKRIAKAAIALSAAAFVVAVATVPVKAAATHTVTFIYGTNVFPEAVNDGGNAIAPANTYVEGYTFTGWVGNLLNVTEDRIILGAYTKVVPTQTATTCNTEMYSVRFVDCFTGKEYYSTRVARGGDAIPPEVPYHEGMRFDGYSGCYTNVTSDRTIYAKYASLYFDYYAGPLPYTYGWYGYYGCYNPWAYRTCYYNPTTCIYYGIESPQVPTVGEFCYNTMESNFDKVDSLIDFTVDTMWSNYAQWADDMASVGCY